MIRVNPGLFVAPTDVERVANARSVVRVNIQVSESSWCCYYRGRLLRLLTDLAWFPVQSAKHAPITTIRVWDTMILLHMSGRSQIVLPGVRCCVLDPCPGMQRTRTVLEQLRVFPQILPRGQPVPRISAMAIHPTYSSLRTLETFLLGIFSPIQPRIPSNRQGIAQGAVSTRVCHALISGHVPALCCSLVGPIDTYHTLLLCIGRSSSSVSNRTQVPYFRYFGPTAIVPGFKQMVISIAHPFGIGP